MWAWSHHQERTKGPQDQPGPRRSLEQAQPETCFQEAHVASDKGCCVFASPGGGEEFWQVSVLVENLPTTWATGCADGQHGRWESGREIFIHSFNIC